MEAKMKGETEEMYEKTDSGASAHGHFLEINLLTLFKLQGDKTLQEFHLAGNFRRAGAFDDVVFRYVDDSHRHNIIFLQAKSKVDNTYALGIEIFGAGKMFDLQKHFKGFLTIQDELNNPANDCPIFRGNPQNSNCHFVMYTNAILNENIIEHVQQIENHPLSIVLGQANGHACKLKVETATKLFRDILNADEIKTVITYLKNIANESCKNLQGDQIFKMYHAFLTHTVLIKTGHNWKFRNEFLEGGFQNETIKKLREETIKFYAEERWGMNNNISNDEIIAHMRNWEVKLPHWMESKIPKFETSLCNKFIETASRGISGNICRIENMSKGLLNNVAKFAGNVFVFDEKNAMFKFNEEKMDGETGKWLAYMRGKFNVPHLTFDFQDEKLPRLSLGFGKLDPKMQEFISKLMILTGQPSEGNLKDLIKQVISINISDEEAKMRCLQMKDKITDWWQHPNSAKYLKKDDKFFDGILSGIKFHLTSPLKSFVGRADELQKLHQALQNRDCKSIVVISQMMSISGLGGIGKTELARQYANKYGDSYDGNIIWIDAETHNTMTASFHNLCKNCLKVSTQNADNKEMEISAIVQQVYSFFSHRKCLFVFDNATQFKSDSKGNDGIKSFLPDTQLGTSLHFLITSRNQNWPSEDNLQLDVFKDSEAKQLVKLSLGIPDGQQDKDVKELISQLGNFPLALQQALAYIRQMDKKYQKAMGKPFTISDYLKMYASKSKDLLDFEFPSDCNDTYTKTTFMTWNITLAVIEKHKLGKEARQVVNIMAYLNPNDIQTTFFTEVVDNSDEKLIGVFNLIEGYSMITLHDGKANIHRLVQSVTRITLQGAKQKVTLKNALGLIRNHTDNNLIIHGESAWSYVNLDEDLVKEFHNLPSTIVAALHDIVRYEQASDFGKQSVNSLKHVIGADHPSTLTTQHNVARTLFDQGKYDEALCCYREVFQKQLKVLGPDEPYTFITQHNVAQTLSYQGKYDEALCCYREVLEKQLKVLGPDEPYTFITQCNVAQTLSHQGKYEEALCSYREVLAKQIKILGPDNKSTLATQHNIAQTLSKQGKYEEALCSYREVLEKKIKIWGPDKPSTLATQHDIAYTLSNQGKYEEALCSFRELIAKQIKILGPDNASTLTTQHNFAQTLSEQGKYEEALCSYREVLEKQITILGPDNPSTLTTQHNVANALSNQGKYEEALCSYREVLEKQITLLGPDNPSTLTTQHNVAQTLAKQGKYEEAICSYREVLEKKIKILGPDNPSTLVTQHEVAQTLSEQGKYDEAQYTYRDVFEKQFKILGPDNPFTVTTHLHIAQILSEQGKYDEALCSYRDVFEKQFKILGPDNPSTLTTQNYIAKTLSKQGKREEALCSYRDVLEKKIKILGPDNPSTLATQHEVAQTLSNEGKHEEALCSYREVLEKLIKILGPEHPYTMSTEHNIAQTLSDQGKYKEAVCFYREVLEKKINILGPDNPSTLATKHNVAQTLFKQGKYDEALCYYREVLEMTIKILGPDNPCTWSTQHCVAQTLSNQGKYEEALCSYREVLEKHIKILGPEHPDTLAIQRNVAQTMYEMGMCEEALCSYKRTLEEGIKILGPYHPYNFITLYNILQIMSSQKK